MGLLSFLFLALSPRAQTNVVRAQNWLEVADFLIEEDDRDSFQQFQEKVIRERSWDLPLVSRIVDVHFSKRDRKAVMDFLGRIALELKCSSPVHQSKGSRSACEELNRLWSNNLDSLLFFHDSAPKLEQGRRLLEHKDCSAALTVLKEVESKEGPARPILERLLGAYRCLQDVASEATVLEQLRQIRIFASEL